MGHPKRYRREPENRPFRRQLITNTVASGMSNGWAMVAGLVSVPLLLSGLGREAFGVWALVMTFSATNGWLSLADLGAVVATTRRVAASMAVEDRRAARRTIGAGLTVAGVTSAGGAALLALSSTFLPALFHTPAALVTPFRQALLLMSAQVV